MPKLAILWYNFRACVTESEVQLSCLNSPFFGTTSVPESRFSEITKYLISGTPLEPSFWPAQKFGVHLTVGDKNRFTE